LFFYYLIFLFLFTIILRPFSTLIHELGHGIPGLLFTDKKVTLYLGSYGDPKKSIRIQIKRLELFFNKNPFHWKIGLCVLEQKKLSVNKNIIMILMGPVASLALSIILTYLATPIELYNGSTVFNDGKQIMNLWEYRKVPDEYNIGVNYYNNKEYNKAIVEFEKVYAKGFQKLVIYRLLISAYLQIKDYQNALRLNNLYHNKFEKKFNSYDYTNSGLIKSYTAKLEEALKDYNKAIELNSKNSLALNNRGYTYNLIGDYENAIKDFEEAISLEENFAYALNNRGFAKIKLGRKEEGLKDLEKSMTLDDTNSYCHLNFGVYHYDNGEYEKAFEYYTKARELDEKTYLLDDYIEKVKNKLRL